MQNYTGEETNEMDIQTEYVDPPPSAFAFHNRSFFKAEDSGYHTSYTPGSLECSELSSDIFDQSFLTGKAYISTDIRYTPEGNPRISRKSSASKRNDVDTPVLRRAVKRPHPSADVIPEKSPMPTPTTYIAGKIERLEVNEDKENSTLNTKKPCAKSAKIYRKIQAFESSLEYPVTPIKRNCSTSPCKGSARKLDFTIHSLICDKKVLQRVNVQESLAKIHPRQPIKALPDQKLDILHLLHKSSAVPPLKKIFSYLTIPDVFNFCLVSSKWNEVWEKHNSEKKKQQLKQFIRTAKENCENEQTVITPKLNFKPYDGCLKEIHNELNENCMIPKHTSPPHTPKSNRFRKFVKLASLDSRTQMSCVRCHQPAKVTKESTGESWVDCTNSNCGFQFCNLCYSPRHTGTTCFQYDLNGPSPSKRKKCENLIGTKKSRKNLRRLL